MNLNKLYDLIEELNITVDNFQMENAKALCVLCDDGNGYIAIDDRKVKTSIEEKTILAHEAGHCATGAFYNRYSKFDVIGKHEYRADKWAANQLIPFDDLIDFLKRGAENLYEVAEHFGITEEFAERACKIYGLLG